MDIRKPLFEENSLTGARGRQGNWFRQGNCFRQGRPFEWCVTTWRWSLEPRWPRAETIDPA